MGHVYASQLAKPGNYILSLLRANPSLRYSEHFYDGTDELCDRVAAAMGLDQGDADLMPILVDIAVGQMESQGIVNTTQLPEKMSDGENDYLIEPTEQGQNHIESGSPLQFRDLYL